MGKVHVSCCLMADATANKPSNPEEKQNLHIVDSFLFEIEFHGLKSNLISCFKHKIFPQANKNFLTTIFV